jgi:hypothetical protein
MTLGRTQALWPGISRRLGASRPLLSVWGSTAFSDRSSAEGSEPHHHPAALHRRLGCAIGSTAWRDRLPSSAPAVGLAVHGGGLLARACSPPVAPLRSPPRACRQRHGAIRRGRRAVAGPSPVSLRGLGRLQPRYPGPPGRLRPADGAAARVRLARGATAGAVPSRQSTTCAAWAWATPPCATTAGWTGSADTGNDSCTIHTPPIPPN